MPMPLLRALRYSLDLKLAMSVYCARVLTISFKIDTDSRIKSALANAQDPCHYENRMFCRKFFLIPRKGIDPGQEFSQR